MVTHIHKCPPLVTFLSQMNLLHILAAHCLFYPFITCWFLTLKSSQLPAESHTCMITSCQLSVIANLHIQKTNKLCLLSSVRGGPTVRQYLCLLQSRRLNSEEGRQGKPHSYWTVRGNGVQTVQQSYFSVTVTLVHVDDSSGLIFLKMIIAWRLPSPSVKSAHIILHPHVSDLLLSQPVKFNKVFGNRQFDQIYCFLASKFLFSFLPQFQIHSNLFFYFVASIFISFFYCKVSFVCFSFLSSG